MNFKKVLAMVLSLMVVLTALSGFCAFAADTDAKITEIDYSQSKGNRGLVVEITDPALLAQTGGIVQGMSGSPILQNGKLIGAVTHVFVNDPTKGYGIFIENMLEH